MTSVYYILYTYNVYKNSLFHRDETKPTHIIGINSFLFLMQLIYKHSSPNYQHMINHWKLINNIIVLYMCAYVETFSTAFTSLPFVMFYNMQFIRFHIIYMHMKFFFKSWRSSFVNFLFSSYTIHITLLNNCINTVILAEQSLHHNIILEKLDHCWVNRICTNFSIYESSQMTLHHI